MGYEVLEGSFFLVDRDSGVTSPLGWIDSSGIAFEGASGDDIKTISSFQGMTVSFTMTGRTAEKTARILLGLPYKHPRQILHNGKKP